jgi:hypothetical protein
MQLEHGIMALGLSVLAHWQHSFTLVCSKSFWQCKYIHQYTPAACGEQKTSFCMGYSIPKFISWSD